MKTFFLFLLCTLSAVQLSAQIRALRITNSSSDQEVVIVENKHVRMKTQDGKKHKGRLTIVNQDSIAIGRRSYALLDIAQIKRNPLLVSAATTGLLLYGGIVLAGSALILAAFTGPTGLYLLIPAAGMIYAGIKSPNFFRTYSRTNGWIFNLEMDYTP